MVGHVTIQLLEALILFGENLEQVGTSFNERGDIDIGRHRPTNVIDTDLIVIENRI